MFRREDKIYDEAAALWRAVHRSAPPSNCDGAELILQVLQSMDIDDYQRLDEADRRAGQIAWPAFDARS